MASYVRAQRVGDAAYDRYRAGDSTALSAHAIRGLALFRGRANCATCHRMTLNMPALAAAARRNRGLELAQHEA